MPVKKIKTLADLDVIKKEITARNLKIGKEIKENNHKNDERDPDIPFL